MSYFFRTNNFDLDKYDFDIEVIPRFTRKEQEFLILLLDNLNEETGHSVIERPLISLGEDEMKKIILSLMKKTLYSSVITEEGKKSELYFGIFDFIIINQLIH